MYMCRLCRYISSYIWHVHGFTFSVQITKNSYSAANGIGWPKNISACFFSFFPLVSRVWALLSFKHSFCNPLQRPWSGNFYPINAWKKSCQKPPFLSHPMRLNTEENQPMTEKRIRRSVSVSISDYVIALKNKHQYLALKITE